METSSGGNSLQRFGNWLSDAYRLYRDSSRLQGWQDFAKRMAEVGSTNAQSEAELRVKQKARRHLVEARAAQSMGEALVHGAEFEQELRAEVGGTSLDDGRVWRLVSVSTHHLDTFEEGEIRGEIHVLGVYVDHVKHPNSDACPPTELELGSR